MKTFTKFALFFLLISVCIQLYLTLQHYPLKLGFSTGPSVCTINQTFDCDAVSISPYSALFGIPVSIWGGVVYLMTFGALLLSWLEWTENPERLKRFAFSLSLLSLIASLVMGGISLFMMKNYCLFCMVLYVLSAVIAFLIGKTLKAPYFSGLKDDVCSYWQENRGILAALVAVPVLSFMFHRMFLSHFGASELEAFVNRGVRTWIAEPMQSLSVAPLLVAGPEKANAKMTISEFADFRCGHCKSAAHSLHAFTQAHPDVRFEFYVFPLDGACNPGIERSSGLSCLLAKAVYCAEKQGKGWDFHSIIFQYQEQLAQVSQVEPLKEDLKKLTQHLGTNQEELDTCLNSADTQEAIKYQAQQGLTLKIRGTPALFANGKLIENGSIIPVLQAIYRQSKGSPAQ